MKNDLDTSTKVIHDAYKLCWTMAQLFAEQNITFSVSTVACVLLGVYGYEKTSDDHGTKQEFLDLCGSMYDSFKLRMTAANKKRVN